MSADSRWTTSNSAYGSFWKAIPLEPKIFPKPPSAGSEVIQQRRERLSQLLREHGVRERPVEGDGNCQFRALADQLYGSEDHHAAIREQVIDQLRAEPHRYKGFVEGGNYDDYVAEMARNGTWGDHVTLQAAADAMGARIHVLTDNLTEAFIQVLPQSQKTSKVLKISFWAEVHYNSLAERSGGQAGNCPF